VKSEAKDVYSYIDPCQQGSMSLCMSFGLRNRCKNPSMRRVFVIKFIVMEREHNTRS